MTDRRQSKRSTAIVERASLGKREKEECIGSPDDSEEKESQHDVHSLFLVKFTKTNNVSII